LGSCSQGHTPDFVVSKTLRNTRNALLGRLFLQPPKVVKNPTLIVVASVYLVMLISSQ
jgi:hypothetical protein